MTDSEKLRKLADWIDKSKWKPSIIADLRRIADELERQANRYTIDPRPKSRHEI